jgi:hypothetical protein
MRKPRKEALASVCREQNFQHVKELFFFCVSQLQVEIQTDCMSFPLVNKVHWVHLGVLCYLSGPMFPIFHLEINK